MKPVVGVCPLWNNKKSSLYMLPEYVAGISDAGGIPVVFPLIADPEDLNRLTDTVDGILFTGGHDVSPAIYGESPLNDSVLCCPKRDEMEKILLGIAVEKDKPVLGICRGIQLINAALGGKLYQDLPVQYPSDTEHNQHMPYDIPAHKVSVLEASPLYKLLGTKVLAVNSYHHQAVKALAPGLETMAISEDGLIEAVCKPSQRFFWALQWHPESLYQTDPEEKKIFAAFVGACSIGPQISGIRHKENSIIISEGI